MARDSSGRIVQMPDHSCERLHWVADSASIIAGMQIRDHAFHLDLGAQCAAQGVGDGWAARSRTAVVEVWTA